MAKFLNEPMRFMGWLGGCGNMHCTGCRNWMVTDIDGKFGGTGKPI